MMLPLSREFAPACVSQDCRDELANFRFTLKELVELEPELLRLADVVFTGGHSLCKHKRGQPANIYPSLSRLDTQHSNGALILVTEPTDQADFSRPRLLACLGGGDAAPTPFATMANWKP